MLAEKPALGSLEFHRLADLFREKAGLSFADSAHFTFERRLGERLTELGFASFHEYYRYLRLERGAAELENALTLVTTAETYFFRQEYQLRSFQQECLPVLAQRNAASRRLVVWSAGCSTGEEVYTLAMLIEQSQLFNDWQVRVIGSDLSAARVAHARRGIYKSASFRATPQEALAHYFVRHGEQRDAAFRVVDRIKARCHFAQLNLKSDFAASGIGRVDVVFCRNVLIYFAPADRTQVIDRLYERLVPGGYLCLGHSESLLNVSTAFELVHLSEDLVYRRPRSSSRWEEEG